MHAFLIVGNTSELVEKEIASRIKEWKISSWDIIRAAGTGIADVRNFRRELSMTARGKNKVGIIEQIDLLTTEAQNALLKTLEEPPPNTYIIGTTATPEALLPTIRSRMSIVPLKNTPEVIDESFQKLLADLLAASAGKKLQLLEPYEATRDDAKKFISALLSTAHQEILSHPSPRLTTLIRNLLAARQQLSVNVNQKLVIDNAVL